MPQIMEARHTEVIFIVYLKEMIWHTLSKKEKHRIDLHKAKKLYDVLQDHVEFRDIE